MDGFAAPNSSPMTTRNGLGLLQQVRGRYLSIHYDVPALLSSYVRLLDQLGVMSADMKTCKFQTRMLYEGHSALYHLLKKMHIDSSETRVAEMRFAGGLELAWHSIRPLHEVIQEYVALDEMECWFQHSAISDQLAEMWKMLDATFVEFRDELRCPVEPFIALGDTLARVLAVPGQADVAQRQVHRADQLELPKLFKNLVTELDSGTSLLFMKSMYIEEFMEAMQKEMNQHPAKSQTYKLYDERLQQLFLHSKVMPPVNEFDSNDIRQTSENPISESPPGSVFRGRTTSGDIVSIKMLSAFSSTEKQETLYAEVQRWNRLRHPHIQRVLGIWYPYSSRDGFFAVVSKGIKRGDIIAYIKSHPTYDRAQALLEVGLGVQYLHSQGVPHGDLRGLNVLIKENGEPCLTNFGLMHALEVGCDVHTAMALLELGSVRWMAPEIYDAELIGKERGSPSAEADCHSFGMLVLEVISGQKPFSYIAQDPVVVIELVRGGRPMRPIASQNSRRDSAFQVIDDSLWHLCESCWAFPPEKRLTIGEIVDVIRAHLQATRLEESRSRVGGNLLTLQGPAGHYEFPFSPTKEKRSMSRSGTAASPLLIRDKAFNVSHAPTSPAGPSPLPPAIEYIARSAPSTIHTRHSKSTTKPPLITPMSPSASSRGSRRSAVPNGAVPGVTEEQESENEIGGGGYNGSNDQNGTAFAAAQEMLTEAQEVIEFERRVLDEAESRLHDLQDALNGEERPHPDEDGADDRESVILHEVANARAASIRDGGSVEQHTPPTQDDPIMSQNVRSPVPRPAGAKAAHRSNDHRSMGSASYPGPSRDTARHTPSQVGRPTPKVTIGATPRATPRASVAESSGPSFASVTVQQQFERVRSPGGSQRPRSTSQHSISLSQTSGPSRTSALRSPRHPDLARASQVPLLDSSSLVEVGEPSMVGVNRLSTILDVTDGEEARALGEQPQQHAEEDPYWFDGQRGGEDWEFLRLVQENRKQRNAGNGDDTFSPTADSVTGKEWRGAAESSMASSGPLKRFPPAPAIVVRTPASLARSKDLPPLPSPSIGCSQHWGIMDVGNGVAVDPDNEYVLASSKASHSKGKKSSDSVVTAIHFSQLKSPYMRPLPSSSIGQHTGSTATSQSIPQSALHVSKRSSAVSARGSIPKLEQLEQIVSRGHGSAKARDQQFAGNKTASTLSTAQQEELIGIGNAVCPRCGRQFSTKTILDRHILKQGGQCHQRSLQQDLAFVGADLEE